MAQDADMKLVSKSSVWPVFTFGILVLYLHESRGINIDRGKSFQNSMAGIPFGKGSVENLMNVIQ